MTKSGDQLSKLLSDIEHPQSLKKLNTQELNQLAQEIRELIINVVAKKGGHLASSLGVVELTVALHSIFQAPKDKIVWDVGHQCYAHKILTGRKDLFQEMRSLGGISGFPRREESLYDPFGTGHSSTSLSAALGIALARDLRQEDYKVIAVIGDGALTGGMALEALNYAGEIDTDLIAILNDNKLSIDQNVGGLPSHLARLRSDPKYYRLKEELEFFLERIPAIGKTMLRSAERLKDSVKYLLVPGVLFEELGFTYLGPVDGHNIYNLQDLMRQAQKIKGPVLLHVVTQKGKGYSLAEKEPCYFHGIGPFHKDTGKLLVSDSSSISYSEIFGSSLLKMAEEDESIVAITAAMASGTGLEPFSQKYSQRFYDVGIAEQNAVTMGAGMAAGGRKPVIAIYSTFLQRAYDQILHDVCLQKLPVVFAIDRAGVVGEDGETHNGLFDYAYLRHMPEIVVMAPTNGQEITAMLKTALTLQGPSAIRYPKGKTSPLSNTKIETLLPGKGILVKEGNDLLILAAGSMLPRALEAWKALKREDIYCSVINPRFIKPLDKELICKWAQTCKKVLTVEEHVLAGGFGSAVLELFEEENMTQIKVKRMGIKNPFTGQGSREQILKLNGLSTEGIVQEAIKLCQATAKIN